MRQQENFQFEPTRSATGFRMFKIIGLIFIAIFLFGLLGFYVLFHIMKKSADENENGLTTLEGVFEINDSILAPVSGKTTAVAQIKVSWNTWSPGSHDDYTCYYDFLDYKPGTVLKVNGKKYIIVGTQVRMFRGKKNCSPVVGLTIKRMQTKCDTIPNAIMGIDRRLDYYIDKLKTGYIQAANARLNLTERRYSSTDTVMISAFVRNDTIFLENRKY